MVRDETVNDLATVTYWEGKNSWASGPGARFADGDWDHAPARRAGFRICLPWGQRTRPAWCVCLAAAGRGGGSHVERRKSTDPKVPIGTIESSPRFQPWVASGESPEPPRGDRKDGTGPVRSFVPDGTRFIFVRQPSDKSLGYFRASLRDVESRHAKHVRAILAVVEDGSLPPGIPPLNAELTALPARWPARL